MIDGRRRRLKEPLLHTVKAINDAHFELPFHFSIFVVALSSDLFRLLRSSVLLLAVLKAFTSSHNPTDTAVLQELDSYHSGLGSSRNTAT